MPRHTLLLPAVAAILWATSPVAASAQQDTSPPVLLDFSFSPSALDTGPGPVSLTWCADVHDDPAGVAGVEIQVNIPNGAHLFGDGQAFNAPQPTDVSLCRSFTVGQGQAYGTYLIRVDLLDGAGNRKTYLHSTLVGPNDADLCALGICETTNRPAVALPDGDGDGIPDDADNCPTIANADQADRDLDGLGDLCDPFPDDRDNEQAQCEADLAQCIADQTSCPTDLAQAQQDLATWQGTLASTQTTLTETQAALSTCESTLSAVEAELAAATADADAVRDLDDDCPGTPPAVAVDRQGCSQEQFCAAISVQESTGRKACLRADWKNDEPLMTTRERDCAIDRNLAGGGDDKCVASVQ